MLDLWGYKAWVARTKEWVAIAKRQVAKAKRLVAIASPNMTYHFEEGIHCNQGFA
jgi:hypothetical protein